MSITTARQVSGALPAACVAACVAVLLGLTAGPARGQITLSQDFDSGSLNVPLSTVSGSTVTLAGRRTWTGTYGSYWRWINFEAGGVNGIAPTFRITSSNFLGSLSGHRFVYSYDRENWSFFETGSVSGGFYTFGNSQPFTQDKVYVAYHFPYPVSRTAAHTIAAAASPFVTPAPSTGGDFIIGTSVGGTDELGRSIPPQNLYAYRITDAAAANVAKKKVILAAGNHSGEPMGSFILEGVVNWMLDNTARAALLRRHADTFVYPQVNPEGRYAGYYRSNPENPGKDYNRYWNNPAGFTDLTQLRNAMMSHVGGDADYIVDFHSFFDQGGDFVNVTSALANSPFMVALRGYEPGVSAAVTAGDPGMLRVWGAALAGLKAEYTYTPEIGPKAGRTEAQVLAMGASHAKALFDAIVPLTVKAWEIDADGAWSTSANWVHDTPNASNQDVYFGGHVTGPRTISVDAPHAAGTFTFDSDHAYALAGPGVLTLGGAIDVIRGTHTIAAPLTLASDIGISVRRAGDVLSISGELNATAGHIAKTGAGAVELNNVRAAGLNIGEGIVRARPNGTPGGTSRLGAFEIAGGAAPTATLDLADNALILDYADASASPAALVAQQVAAARNGGTWDGPGITSSTADDASFSLGLAESNVVFTSFPATFSGQQVDDTTLLVAFTRYGDSNLDGLVNLADFNALANNFGLSDRSWWQADFNYDTLVNLGDFNLLADNFGLSASGAEVTPQDWANLAAAVPEPGMLSVPLLTVIGGATARVRRREAPRL